MFHRALITFVLAITWSHALAATLPAIQTVRIGDNQELLVNGQAFFPIMSWMQSPRIFPKLRSMHFNTLNQSGKTAEQALRIAEESGLYAMMSSTLFDSAFKNHKQLLMYSLPDEPDMGIKKGKARVSADEVLKWGNDLRKNDPSRPIFLNYTGQFKLDHGGDQPGARAYYQKTANAADVLCFDIYPIYQENRDDRLIWVAEGVSELQQIPKHKKPVWAWIETSKGSKWITYSNQKDVTPAIIRSEIWMAIIRGAKGIGYFTHAWRPSFTEFAPKQDVQDEIARSNKMITDLASVILSEEPADKASIVFKEGLHGECMVRHDKTHTYIFANNLDMKDLGKRMDKVAATYRGGTAAISLQGIKKNTVIEVVGENREIKAKKKGELTDTFAPLAVHIYKFKR